MSGADELIRDIVNSSQIPSRTRRDAVLRELRSHVEDFMLAAREAGHPDEEIQRLVIAAFGDARHIARDFAWVYRHERMMLRISAFVLSTLAVAILFSAAILAMQAGVAIGFGIPVVNVIASRHTVIEVLDIVSTVAAYVGLISLEKLFERHHFQKAIAWLTLTFAAAMAVFAVANVRAPFLVFGFANGVFFRTLQIFMKSSTARTGIALVCFALAGFVSYQVWSPVFQYALAVNCTSWLIMGAGYQLIAEFAPRVDAALFNGIQRI